MRRSDALGRGCEDGKGGAPLDGEAWFGATPSTCSLGNAAWSDEFAVRDLNGTLFDADLSFEMFEGGALVHLLGRFRSRGGFVEVR